MDVTDSLPISRVDELRAVPQTSWLIDSLWLTAAVGLIGAQPKSCKTWLGLDMAVSVASGTPCLGRFAVASPGPTLVYLAEDDLEQLRRRVEGIAKSRQLTLADLDLSVITCPVLRLDTAADQERLISSVARLRPKLLLLDPLVRLHRLDENNAKDISGLLGFLRELQRSYGVAIVLAHHASKRSHARPGQGLRGSSDLHAFGDSNLYLSRQGDEIEVTVEHRSAAAEEPFRMHLAGDDERTHLTLVTAAASVASPQLDERIFAALTAAAAPMTRAELRQKLRVNNQRLGGELARLSQAGALVATAAGFNLPDFAT